MPIYKFEHGFYAELQKVGGLSYIWANAVGGHHSFKASDLDNKNALFFEGDSFDDFAVESEARRVLQDVLLNHLMLGWIDRQGRFYSCGMNKHTDLAEIICGDWMVPENEGWVKINHKNWRLGSSDFTSKITQAQKRKLSIIGRSPDDQSYVDSKIKFEDAFPNGNRVMRNLIEKYEAIVEQEQAKRQPIQPTLDML